DLPYCPPSCVPLLFFLWPAAQPVRLTRQAPTAQAPTPPFPEPNPPPGLAIGMAQTENCSVSCRTAKAAIRSYCETAKAQDFTTRPLPAKINYYLQEGKRSLRLSRYVSPGRVNHISRYAHSAS